MFAHWQERHKRRCGAGGNASAISALDQFLHADKKGSADLLGCSGWPRPLRSRSQHRHKETPISSYDTAPWATDSWHRPQSSTTDAAKTQHLVLSGVDLLSHFASIHALDVRCPASVGTPASDSTEIGWAATDYGLSPEAATIRRGRAEPPLVALAV
jgi:hypothetical protein